jgi:phage-related protein
VPCTKVVLFRETDGSVPMLEWLDTLPAKAQDKCIVRIERLRDMGHELRRPEADLLRDGIHELRVGLQGINYRMLYFFYGKTAVVLTQGLVKRKAVPAREIALALRRKQAFDADPEAHTHQENES